LIQVKDILKDSYTAKKEERDEERKSRQTEKREKREEKLEKPKVKPQESKGMKMPNLGLGIGNFLSWLVMGLIVGKLLTLMPALKKIFSVLKPIADFIGGVFNVVMGFVVGFINTAYAGIEKLEKAIEAIGGEGAKELFEKFGKLFTQVMNGALIAALIALRVAKFGKTPKGPEGSTPKKPKGRFGKSRIGRFFRDQKAKRIKLMRSFKRSRVGKILNALRPKNIGKWIMDGGVDKALKGGVKNVRSIADGLVKAASKPREFFRTLQNTKLGSTITKLATKGLSTATQLGKTGLKTGLKSLKALKRIVSPVVKRIPVVGSLIDFALNYFVFKEPLGKAAFMAIGAGLAAWLGGTIGSIVPVAGTIVGAALGGWAGDKLAGLLYDGIFGNNNVPEPLEDDTSEKDINNTIESNNTQSMSQGLDTKPSYGSDGMMVLYNTTTYIQPVEV
jgi:hypothetical protein